MSVRHAAPGCLAVMLRQQSRILMHMSSAARRGGPAVQCGSVCCFRMQIWDATEYAECSGVLWSSEIVPNMHMAPYSFVSPLHPLHVPCMVPLHSDSVMAC